MKASVQYNDFIGTASAQETTRALSRFYQQEEQ